MHGGVSGNRLESGSSTEYAKEIINIDIIIHNLFLSYFSSLDEQNRE